MKSRYLAVLFVVPILLIIVFALVNFLFLVTPNVEGARDAYFTKVKHGATAYEGKNFTLSLTTYNKNCSTGSEGSAIFYFLFYLDGDLWWDEYNNTEYQTWSCKKGSSVVRSFSVPTWQSVKPAVHDLRIELYWHDDNASRLQDVSSFPVSVAVHVDRGNLMIYGYIIVLVAAIFVLGFYMSTTGPVPSAIQTEDDLFMLDARTEEAVDFQPKVRGYRFLPFCIFVLASWQVTNILPYALSVSEQSLPFLHLVVQIIYIGMVVSFIRSEKSSFRRYGFVWPEETKKYVAVILLLVVSYTFIASFLPGISEGYNVFPALSLTAFFSLILSASVASFASETIFRGYLQTKLTDLSGLLRGLIATSIMFSLFEVSLWPFDTSHTFFNALSLFALGLFLGILYYRTKTLLCPIMFHLVISILNPIMSVEAVASEYTKFLLQLAATGLSLLLLVILTLKTGRETLDQEIVCERSLY